jgi:hypothetical protein
LLRRNARIVGREFDDRLRRVEFQALHEVFFEREPMSCIKIRDAISQKGMLGVVAPFLPKRTISVVFRTRKRARCVTDRKPS